MIEFYSISPNTEWPYIFSDSALLIFCDADFQFPLERIAELKPSYVGFVGPSGEAMHDAFDELAVRDKLDVLTTWHVDEALDEVAWEFCKLHYPLNSRTGRGYVLEYEGTSLIEAVRQQVALD